MLGRILKTAGVLTFGFLLGTSVGKMLNFESQKKVVYGDYQNIITIGYDTNGDKYEDTKLFYNIKGINDTSENVMELILVQKDLNKNHLFEENEITWAKSEEKKEK